MLRAVALAAVLSACGRLGFDPLTSRGDGGGDDASGGDAAAPLCTFGPFGMPTTDASINSNATDWGPSLSSDGLTLIFSSSRGGGVDRLFITKRADTLS